MGNETPFKVAIVTGRIARHRRGGRGAPRARRLRRGDRLPGDAAPAEALARKLEGSGGRAVAVKADVADAQAVRGLFDAADAAFGGVDVLVNNAGMMSLSAIAETDDAGSIACPRQPEGHLQHAARGRKRLRKGGRIINFSSSVVGLLQPTYGAYAATKAAVEALTSDPRQGAARPRHHRQRCRAGPTATDLFLDGKSRSWSSALAKLRAARTPRPARRHRRRGRLPRRPRRRLGQRTDAARQRRRRSERAAEASAGIERNSHETGHRHHRRV